MIFSSFSFLREHIHLPLCRSRIQSPRRLGTFLLALILLPLSYVLGAFAATVIPAVRPPLTETGALVPAGGKPPVANATADELKQYNAWYADLSGEKVIYLTFDAGYENGNTPSILDALKKHQVPAAFFVVGNYLETSPDLVKRMISEGHIVANHTYHHPDMSKISDRESFAKRALKPRSTLHRDHRGRPCGNTTGRPRENTAK